MTSSKMPPPWLINMQRYGPPPSYPSLRIPGLNAPIPTGRRHLGVRQAPALRHHQRRRRGSPPCTNGVLLTLVWMCRACVSTGSFPVVGCHQPH